MVVNLEDIVETLEIQDESCTSYLNMANGKTIILMPEYGDETEAEEVASAIGTKYLPLPTKFDVYEYGIMEDFIASLTNPKVADDLSEAIRGKGAFSRFKTHIAYWSIEKQWYKFLHKALLEVAVCWCVENNVTYKGQDTDKSSSHLQGIA